MSKHEKYGWIAGRIPNALVFECPSLLRRVKSCPVSSKAKWLWKALEPTGHERRGCPYRLKVFLTQERLALQIITCGIHG